MSDQVRVRFAPSPTGLLHIGGLRTALYNYLFAKHHGGVFVLRIEDTDQNRYVDGAEQDIIQSLQWAGLPFDEGPGTQGDFGPYRQSERSDLYKKYASELLDKGLAYYAFDTPEELEAMRESLQSDSNPNPRYDANTRLKMRNSLTLPASEVEALLKDNVPHVIRLKVNESDVVRFDDMIRGKVSFSGSEIDDQILLKSDGLPTYHLANVVDDHLMKISHVIRGEEWLSSAPKHILLYQYLGWESPKMAHLPLIMSPSGGKLSKRKAEQEGIPVNVRDYISGDYEAEAVVNFLAFLGWSPGDDRELFTLDEMISEFSLERVSKSGAIFNYKKLMWYNEHYLRASDSKEIVPRIMPFLQEEGFDADFDFAVEVVRLLKERVSLPVEIIKQGRFFFEAPKAYDEKSVKKAWKAETPDFVKHYTEKVSGLAEKEWEASKLKSALEETIAVFEVGFGKLMLPLRVAVTGVGAGPDLFESMALLGKEEVLKRIDSALAALGE